MNYDDKIRCICKEDYRYFFDYDNVVAIGLGYKIKNGFNTFKKCIKVFVKRKFQRYSLRYESLIPREYKGIKTDIVESGFLKMQSLNKKVRPTLGGYNIGTITLDSNGTLGCLVYDGDEYYLLSNNHVLTFYNSVDIATPILQPGKFVGGANPKNIIATLSKYIPLKETTIYKEQINYVDCAIARIPNLSFASSKIALIGKLQGISSPKLGDKVRKVGCSTELTNGTINTLGVTATIFGEDNKEYIYKDQIFTSSMSCGGDSGAILVNKDKKAVALLMGGSDCVSVHSPLYRVLKALSVKIVI